MNKYNDVKRECQKGCRNTRANFVNNLFGDDGNCNKKHFWHYVKSLNKDNVCHSSLKNNDGSLVTDPHKMSEMFNKQFGSVFSAPTKTSPDKTLTNNYPEMPPLTVTSKGVHKLLTHCKIRHLKSVMNLHYF